MGSHYSPDMGNFLPEGLLDLAFNLLLRGFPGNEELDLIVFVKHHHGFFSYERMNQDHLSSLQSGQCIKSAFSPDSQTAGLGTRCEKFGVEVFNRDHIDTGKIPRSGKWLAGGYD